MAIARLHSSSSFGPFLDDSEHDQSSPRASKLLKMWRELENEHARNQSFGLRCRTNSSDSECLSTLTSLGCDNGDDVSQQSDDSENHEYIDSDTDHEENGSVVSAEMGGIERGRVRQVFQEWMNVGTKSLSSCGFKRSGEWLGENECERVRIIREWVQMTAQQRNCESLRDCDAEFGSQIEQARDGLVLDSPKRGARRPIRRLCGRQTLLDLLFRAQSERNSELLGLSELKPVSRFAHRNRIQSHLRARFLRIESLAPEGKTLSGAATELGLLRLRHTVSDLREEFISKSENSASASAFVNVAETDSSSSGLNSKDSEPPRSTTAINVMESRGLDNRGREQEVMHCGVESSLDIEVQQVEEISEVEYSGYSEQVNAIMINEPSAEVVEANVGVQDEVYNENELVNDSRNDFLVEGDCVRNFEEFSLSQMEAYQEQLNAAASTRQATGGVEEASRSFMEDPSDQWPPELSHRNVEERDHLEEDWTRQNFEEMSDRYVEEQNWVQESNENWGPSEIVGTVGRSGSFYFSDDDNARDMELRELVSRGRVSSLLHSGFRESLDRVLQSHAERLAYASDDWEFENTSHDQDQLQDGHDLILTHGPERGEFTRTSTFLADSQPLWDVEFQSISNHPLETTELEVINDLRIDMARLQQRMDKMQNMLEACMDMQIELQRSMHQEVSAALNRSVALPDANDSPEKQIRDESQWEHVKNGICCLCCDNKIDSLLYRCGHMCACSKCSESLVRRRGKCPMCEAPVIEAVRAYFVQ